MQFFLTLADDTLGRRLAGIDFTTRPIDLTFANSSQFFNQQYLAILHHKHQRCGHLTLPDTPIHAAIIHALSSNHSERFSKDKTGHPPYSN